MAMYSEMGGTEEDLMKDYEEMGLDPNEVKHAESICNYDIDNDGEYPEDWEDEYDWTQDDDYWEAEGTTDETADVPETELA